MWKDLFPRDYIFHETKNGILYNYDCVELLRKFPHKCIDLVLTDPPYSKNFIYAYDHLANYCPELMKRGTSLLTIAGHYAIPDIIKKFEGKLKYRWIFCMNQQEGKHPRLAMGIEVMWKPILWYVKDVYPNGRGFIKDMLKITRCDGIEKKYHKWQQTIQWAKFFVSKLTFSEQDIILDPFIGSGTTAVACEELGRRWIGIEIEPEFCEIVVERVNSLSMDE